MSKYIKVTLTYEEYDPLRWKEIQAGLENLTPAPDVITVETLDTEDDNENTDTI